MNDKIMVMSKLIFCKTFCFNLGVSIYLKKHKHLIVIITLNIIIGISKLRRVLLAYSLHNPDIEYCQVLLFKESGALTFKRNHYLGLQ